MGMYDQAEATNLLKASFGITAYTTVTGTKVRVGSNAPTATADMTELTGTGYTAGGQACTWTAGTATVSNVTVLSWTNGSGGAWSAVGVEVWDLSPARKVQGTWTGQPIAIANGNTFQAAAGALTGSLA